jgi:NADH-quinone oxidoreductase subunit N
MDLPTLQNLAASNQWSAIGPELVLGCLALALLGLELLLPKRLHDLIPAFAILGQIGVLLAVVVNFSAVADVAEPRVIFGGLLRPDRLGELLRVFFLLTGILVSVLGVVALAKQRVPRTEFFHLVLVVTAALMLLVQSHHFVMLFVALETVTVGFYILVSYTRTNALSLEAGLKYLIMGSLSSGLLLFGIVLLYGVAGNPALPAHSATPMGFDELRAFLAANPGNFLASAGIVLVLAGVAFKIGAVPFQIWIPDVYQGAPTPVTAFLAVGSKAAGFAILLKLAAVFAPYAALVTTVLGLMAAATILFGNLAALGQTNVKRLIGLSGVSHAGYLLIGVIAALHGQLFAPGAVVFYLFAYLLASFAVFGVMTHVAGPDDADQPLSAYAGLSRSNPWLAAVLAVGLGSLAGIPPLAGFMGKLLLFVAAFQARLYGLLVVAVVGVVISIYYYFGWIQAAFFQDPLPPAKDGSEDPPARTPVGLVAGVALGLLVVGTVLLGFYQSPALGELLGLRW